MFQVIEKDRIRQTSDNGTCGDLFYWIEEIAGTEEAINVQGWSELATIEECYEGENFKVVCID